MNPRRTIQSCSMTNCTKTGIKIKQSNNNYTVDPFADVNPFQDPQQQMRIQLDKPETIDLNVDSYSREELYKLFGFNTSIILTEECMKEAKKVVLKTHPDKSRLDNRYFIFYSEAYKKLMSIYEFQNKNANKKLDTNSYYDKQNAGLLDNMFLQNKNLKESGNFNQWFNDQFDKHKLEDANEHGYDKWLKSDEDIVFTPQNINKDNIGREMEKRKKELSALTPYTGVGDLFTRSSAGGSSLMEYNGNFSSNALFSSEGIGYTDLKQAYAESVIPVSEEDFHKMKQYRNVDEYKRQRESDAVTPMSKEESMRILYNSDKQKNEESAALAYYYAQQSEKANQNTSRFWSNIKLLSYDS